jgi:hypothetical protein
MTIIQRDCHQGHDYDNHGLLKHVSVLVVSKVERVFASDISGPLLTAVRRTWFSEHYNIRYSQGRRHLR